MWIQMWFFELKINKLFQRRNPVSHDNFFVNTGGMMITHLAQNIFYEHTTTKFASIAFPDELKTRYNAAAVSRKCAKCVCTQTKITLGDKYILHKLKNRIKENETWFNTINIFPTLDDRKCVLRSKFKTQYNLVLRVKNSWFFFYQN